MRVTSEGQVTIPQHIREALDILPNSDVEFELVEGGALLRKKPNGRRERQLLEHLKRHRLTAGLAADEILEMTRGEE